MVKTSGSLAEMRLIDICGARHIRAPPMRQRDPHTSCLVALAFVLDNTAGILSAFGMNDPDPTSDSLATWTIPVRREGSGCRLLGNRRGCRVLTG